MARIFKQHYTAKSPSGRRVKKQSRKWYIELRDGQGIRRRVPGFTDKQATQQLAAELEKRAAREASGLVDRFEQHRKRLLTGHVDDYARNLESTVSSATYIRTVITRVRKVLDGCRFTYWPDVTASKVQAFVDELKKRDGLGVQTCNFYLQAIKQFCKWMIQDGRAPDSPVTHLKGGNVRTDRRHDRRALSDDELRLLLETTKNGATRFGMASEDRAVLYSVTVETGLRVGELRSLTWGSFDLTGDPPSVTIEAAYSKHRREDVQPLRPATAAMLDRWSAESGSGDRTHSVFPSMPEKTAKMLRADLADARTHWIEKAEHDAERRRRTESDFLLYRDHSNRVADFHALRHTFITNLTRAGVHPKIAQRLARHSTITLTMDRYSHTVTGELVDGLDALPTLDRTNPTHERQLATGTCDNGPNRLPLSLPKNLPIPVAPQELRVASDCTFEANVTDVSRREESEKQRAKCTPLHPMAPRCTDPSVQPPNGFEPLTCGLQNRWRNIATV